MQHRVVATRRAQLPGGTTVGMLVAGAWLVVVAFALTGNGGVIHHARLIQGGLPFWLVTVLFLVGWQVMLWAMMVPASLGAIQERAAPREKLNFIGGYMAVWSGFGLFAFLSDVGIHATVNSWPWLAFHPWLIAGGTLVLAGTYQLSNLKAASVAACRTLAREPSCGRQGNRTSLRLGLDYGIKCLGASWALMLLAFALAAGSVGMMAVITAAMVWEVTPSGAHMVKITGYCLIAAGVIVLAGPIQGP